MNKFAFLIHPLDMKDVIRHEPKAANKRLELVEKVLQWMPVHKRSDIRGIRSKTGAEVEGWFILVPLLPQQFASMDRSDVMDRIMEAVRLAEKLGASIIGLGGFTAVVGDAGISISKNTKVAVTSGNSYTIATALQGSMLAADKMGIDLGNANIAIIGASGSIGKACAQFLVNQCKKMTLIARSEKRLEKVAQILREKSNTHIKYTTDIAEGIKDADITITATSSAGNIIMAEHLKPGAVVCDVSLPHDVSRDVQKLRPDVLVIEGGVVRVPGDVDFNYDFGYPKNVALACMAETMILALEGHFKDYSLGRGIKLNKVEEITKLAKKHGFEIAGLRSYEEFINDKDIEKIKQNARAKKVAIQNKNS